MRSNRSKEVCWQWGCLWKEGRPRPKEVGEAGAVLLTNQMTPLTLYPVRHWHLQA